MPKERPPCPPPFFFAKGDLKMFVLHLLQDRPMYGYELMKRMSDQHGGVYRPSAGTIYPTLRSLLSRGFVTAREIENRRIYAITPAGRRYLQSRHQEFHERLKEFEASIGPDKAALMMEARSVGKLLAGSMRDLTPDQARRLVSVIGKARRQIIEIITEQR